MPIKSRDKLAKSGLVKSTKTTATTPGIIKIAGIQMASGPYVSANLSEADIERVFASGSGPMASLGRDAQGHQMIPAVALYALVPGIRRETPNGRDRLIDYLVENFDELVYV